MRAGSAVDLPDMNEAKINIPEWTVSELSAALKRTVEDSYGYVRVRGELGNVKYHSSGHVYLDLKDENACLAGVIWRTTARRIKVKLEAGLEVVVTGRITTYPSQSKYQIVIETLAPAGIGALMALLEQRKKALAAEGLFDEARKQLLPHLPGVIGVITSPTGAVIRDILHRLADRFPRRVIVWPVRVQGDGSAAQVAAAIEGFNALPANGPIPRPDLLIVARGGGSLEDLWSFNEEVVVRAAAGSMIPLISAVGHETDVTLIDFAADRRAPTPTAAAEMAVPVRAELMAEVDDLGRRVRTCLTRCFESWRTELRAAARALPAPDAFLATPRQRLDGLADRLPRALRANAHSHHRAFAHVAGRLSPQILRGRLVREGDRLRTYGERVGRALQVLNHRKRERLAGLDHRLNASLRAYAGAARHARARVKELSDRAERAIVGFLDRRADHIERMEQLLTALSYQGVLARGFALVRNEAGAPLREAAAVRAGMRLDIEFADGRVAAVAGTPSAKPKPTFRERLRRRLATQGHRDLFE